MYRLHEPNTILLGTTGHDLAPVDVPAEFLKPADSPRNPAEGKPATVFRYDLMWEFVSAIVERRPAVPSFYDGLQAQIVADAVLESYERPPLGEFVDQLTQSCVPLRLVQQCFTSSFKFQKITECTVLLFVLLNFKTPLEKPFMKVKQLPKRSQVKASDQWDLASLFATRRRLGNRVYEVGEADRRLRKIPRARLADRAKAHRRLPEVRRRDRPRRRAAGNVRLFENGRRHGQ